MKLPYDFIDGATEPQPGFITAVPTPECTELGSHLARFADQEFASTGRDSRCETCAFRAGTLANTSLNVANAFKFAVEGEPFNCHESDRPCGGWVMMRRGTKGNA